MSSNCRGASENVVANTNYHKADEHTYSKINIKLSLFILWVEIAGPKLYDLLFSTNVTITQRDPNFISKPQRKEDEGSLTSRRWLILRREFLNESAAGHARCELGWAEKTRGMTSLRKKYRRREGNFALRRELQVAGVHSSSKEGGSRNERRFSQIRAARWKEKKNETGTPSILD